MANNQSSSSVGQAFARPFKYIADKCFVLYLLFGIFVLAALSVDVFFTFDNIMNVLRQSSLYGVIAIGICMLLLAGDIDLSVGSQVGFTGILAAKLIIEQGFPIYPTFLIAIICGASLGALNGFMVVKFRIPAIVITLGTQGALRGFTYLLTDAYPIYGMPEEAAFIGRGYILSVPTPVIIMIVLYALAVILTEHTKTGRYFYAIGGNREAAYLAGINVKMQEMKLFVISGSLAGITGCILTSRVMTGLPAGGLNYEFDALTAVLIAGVSLSGGKGRVINVLFGAIFIATMANFMILIGMNPYWQQVTRAFALLFAVLFDTLKNGEKSKI